MRFALVLVLILAVASAGCGGVPLTCAEIDALQVGRTADEEALATLPDRIFIGLTDEGTDQNYLVFATSRREVIAPHEVAFFMELSSQT